jgi:hypothetical protein
MASEADLNMELAISRMLRAGVTLAALVVLGGGILYLSRAHGVEPDYRHFHGIPSPADRFVPVFKGIRHLDRVSSIVLAVLLYSFFRP